MQRGIDITLQILAETPNEAAAGVLVHALDSPHATIQEGTLRALLHRRSPAGLKAVVARWHSFSKPAKDVIAEYPGRLSGAARDAVLSDDLQMCANACDAARFASEYDLIPALINVAESDGAEQAEMAAQTLVDLSQLLYDELSQPQEWRKRRDPHLFRANVVSSLELSARRYPQHGRTEILMAFLILCGRDNSALKSILRDPLDRTHSTIVELLTHSSRTAIVELVLSFLDDARAPLAAVNILAQRDDDEFIGFLLKKIGYEPSSSARVNLKRVKKIRWLQQDVERLAALDGEGQHAAAQIALFSDLKHTEKISVFKELIHHGRPPGRRAAVEALTEFQGVEANRLIIKALKDSDVQVQASALKQLRSRGLPGAMSTLIDAIDSPHEVLRRVGRECLNEFTFSRYLSAYEGMSDDVRISTGRLVAKVDPKTAEMLRAEMNAAARSRRLRAIEMALCLDMVAEMESAFHELLDDDDHMVRMEAAWALAECPTEKTRAALRQASLDPSAAVQSAAQRALEEMVASRPRRKDEINLSAVSLPPAGSASAPEAWSW